MSKPDVDSIEGLSPAISIDQKTTGRNPRSTVGTVTEIYDYLRLLYARVGDVHCPECGALVEKQSVDQIIDKILARGNGTKVIIEAPVARGRKGEYKKEIESFRKAGYTRIKIDGEIHDLEEEFNLDKQIKHSISVVVDRIVLKDGVNTRLSDSLETALKIGNGLVIADFSGEEELFSTQYACPHCGASVPEIEPRVFSFNSPFGACPDCLGLGYKQHIDPALIYGDGSKSLREGALTVSGWNMDVGNMSDMYFRALSKHYGFSLDTPYRDLPDDIKQILLYGTGDEKIDMEYRSGRFAGSFTKNFEGIVNNLERRYREASSDYVKYEIEKYMTITPCKTCRGDRLKKEALAVTVGGINIARLCEKSIVNVREFLRSLNLSDTKKIIAERLLKEIDARLSFLINVGLGYLTLSRGAAGLSGGEAQRIRLATQIGSGLTGVLYILDEPSIGLHQRDNDKLIATLERLRDLGNTLIVVEHDVDTMLHSDYLVDVGPGAGVHGGQIVAAGTVQEVMDNPDSLTGKYLRGELTIKTPETRRPVTDRFITVKGAKENNLKNITVKFPVGVITAVTGVSGSGKSSLVNQILYPALSNPIMKTRLVEGKCAGIDGAEYIDKVINIDQSPIGRSPRSNPATYTGVFGFIRELFAKTPDAQSRGYKAGRFSFNVKGGRCEHCSGDGIICISMNFLPDVYVPCEVCGGKRFNRETLEVKYKGKNISDVLDMTVDEACEFFEPIPNIYNKIKTLQDVGLGYIKLGQPATTLSGGEAQRVKLATELSKRSTGRTLYILDEPTTGLHMADVDKLIAILQRLASGGNTIIVIEHNLDVIKCADYIVDLGPEGGDLGGTVIATGTPEQVAENKNSYTGIFLKKVLGNK